LQAKGIQLVIAGSFSQTYLRNAYNNGFICIECPALVDAVTEQLNDKIDAGLLTVIPGDEIEIDYTTSKATYRGQEYGFPALGSVPQSLVVAGGIENLVRKKLGG
ncbi:MAG: homoaconitase, partial [Gemmatimonadota bacterium]